MLTDRWKIFLRDYYNRDTVNKDYEVAAKKLREEDIKRWQVLEKSDVVAAATYNQNIAYEREILTEYYKASEDALYNGGGLRNRKFGLYYTIALPENGLLADPETVNTNAPQIAPPYAHIYFPEPQDANQAYVAIGYGVPNGIPNGFAKIFLYDITLESESIFSHMKDPWDTNLHGSIEEAMKIVIFCITKLRDERFVDSILDLPGEPDFLERKYLQLKPADIYSKL
jgi:hypothetical protein